MGNSLKWSTTGSAWKTLPTPWPTNCLTTPNLNLSAWSLQRLNVVSIVVGTRVRFDYQICYAYKLRQYSLSINWMLFFKIKIIKNMCICLKAWLLRNYILYSSTNLFDLHPRWTNRYSLVETFSCHLIGKKHIKLRMNHHIRQCFFAEKTFHENCHGLAFYLN